MLVHKYLLGVAPNGPFWLNRTGNALDRVDKVKKFLMAANLQSSLVVVNSLWWDLGRLEATDPLLLDPLLLTAEHVHEYMQNLRKLVVDTQEQLSIPPVRVVLHTAVHARVNEGHVSGHQHWKNTHVAQLNHAMRQVAHEMAVHVVDFGHLMQGFPAEHTLSDPIHPMPWVLEHLFSVLMQCLHDDK